MDMFAVIRDSNLSDEHKEIARLRYIERICSYDEVVEITNISKRTFFRKQAEVMKYITDKWHEEN